MGMPVLVLKVQKFGHSRDEDRSWQELLSPGSAGDEQYLFRKRGMMKQKCMLCSLDKENHKNLNFAKGGTKMRKILFLMIILNFSYSLSLGAEYAVDQGSNMFGITAGFINASGDLYEDEEGSSSTTLLVMPSLAHCIVRNFGIGGDLLILDHKQGDTGLSTLGLGPKAMFFFGGKSSGKCRMLKHFLLDSS